jgi:hypothetical protein
VVVSEWVGFVQVATTVIAATGLFLTAWQMGRTRRTSDLQALQKFSEEANAREAALAAATTDESRLHAFNEFLNFLELYACAYNNRLVIGRGGKDIIRHKLEDSYIELDATKQGHPHIANAFDRATTFVELTKLIRRHHKEVERRKAQRAYRLERDDEFSL